MTPKTQSTNNEQTKALDFSSQQVLNHFKKIIFILRKKGETSKTFSNLVKIKNNAYMIQFSDDATFEVKDMNLLISELKKLDLEVKLTSGVPYSKLYLNWE